MVLKSSAIAIILLATFPVSELARIRREEVERRVKSETQAQIAQDTGKSAVEDEPDKAFEAGADAAEANSAGASALVQASVAQGSDFWPFSAALGGLLGKVSRQLGIVPNEASSSFPKTLEYIKRASHMPVNRFTILNAACDSSAFSCEEIIQLANHCWPGGPWAILWADAVRVFEKGRNGTGCISDPANAKLFVDFFRSKFPDSPIALGQLEEAFIDNDNLKPATGVGPPPVHLQTGLRTDEDMEKLFGDIEAMHLSKALGSQGPEGLYEPGSPSVFESWLKQIRSHGEQFSGPQLVALVNATPKNSGTSQAVTSLLQYLEQYVTGVTCQEVVHILQRMDVSTTSRFWLVGLDALHRNIVDGRNKVDIVAFADLRSTIFQTRPLVESLLFVREAEGVLAKVGIGLPPKNNPIFGVVKGNPVILVVDESTSMDANFTLGDDTFTCRNFCHSQLETVLQGLPNGTYFNVIQYSSTAVKIFEKPVLASKASIDAAMEAMGTTWRGNHTLGQDPVEMLQSMKAFALKFKHLERSTKRNAREALRLAYAAADLPSQGRRQLIDALLEQNFSLDFPQLDPEEVVMAKVLPQIYFLTSGQPDGGAHQILDNIYEFDRGRNIPVNSIGFITPADPVAKRFVKDLANKTGGFFRSIEQLSL